VKTVDFLRRLASLSAVSSLSFDLNFGAVRVIFLLTAVWSFYIPTRGGDLGSTMFHRQRENDVRSWQLLVKVIILLLRLGYVIIYNIVIVTRRENAKLKGSGGGAPVRLVDQVAASNIRVCHCRPFKSPAGR